jgi:hypothetical protein
MKLESKIKKKRETRRKRRKKREDLKALYSTKKNF